MPTASLRQRQFGDRLIGPGQPALIIAEIGINHSGSLDHALALIDAAKDARADAVKFQAGDPERYVNPSAWDTPRETPWGTLPYLAYRKRLELSDADFRAIDQHCKAIGLPWFVSPLDAHSVERFEPYHLPAFKVASPKLTDSLLLQRLAATRQSLFVSTGMSTYADIDRALERLPRERVTLFHCTSAYPCPDRAIRLRAILGMQERYPDVPVGYSGHESGLWPSLAAVALGAHVLERHFTLDRTAWGSDQAASLEPTGFAMLVRGVRSIEDALSSSAEKALQDIELPNYRKFRAA